MDISCAFPTTLDTPSHVALAEELGYRRAWVYDTPQQSPDVWMTLALAADRTTRIGIGPGVLVPTLRHPMVNAAGTSALEAMAPGRVAVAFGTGFTGRRAMGYRAITWQYMRDYIAAYRGLLRGEIVEWEGAKMRMLHPAGHGAPRPVEVPILIGAIGPKGHQVATDLGDGVFTVLDVPTFAGEFPWVAFLLWGTVLDEGEDAGSARVRAAAGPGTALAWHGAYEFSGRDAVGDVPGGAEWLTMVDKTPLDERHLDVHEGHCVEMNAADEAGWDVAGEQLFRQATVSGTAAEVRRRLDALLAAGATEIVYQPCGPDIGRELERFGAAARA